MLYLNDILISYQCPKPTCKLDFSTVLIIKMTEDETFHQFAGKPLLKRVPVIEKVLCRICQFRKNQFIRNMYILLDPIN